MERNYYTEVELYWMKGGNTVTHVPRDSKARKCILAIEFLEGINK